ncbi:MAG: hypothetical protein QOG62_1764, partial [Thermoleophilaceae bacterium]|nr:hypothetical protein [Thermoleophilaceae bacterium]
MPVSRRASRSWALVPLALACLLAGCGGGPASADRPNIVFIQTDDQTLCSLVTSDICPEGAPQVMPKTEQLLVDQGTSFDSYFATHPRCCPSRATQFTGMYSHNHGILSNTHGYGRFAFHDVALPVWLQKAGYYTAHVGKYMNGFSDRFADALPVPPGWDESFSLVDDPYHLYGYSLMVKSPVGIKALDGTELAPPAPGAHRVKFGNDDRDYQTDVVSSIAADFIKRRAGQDDPFYLA